MKKSFLNTPLGTMVAIASEVDLIRLSFHDCAVDAVEINHLLKRNNATLISGSNAPLLSIEKELTAWFDGTLKKFNTPYFLWGTVFQKHVWSTISQIPYGETRSYLEQARIIERPSACRAVANANAANQLAIIIPCHRIIQSNGKTGGYAGGVERKQWLIDHEKRHFEERRYPKGE